MTTSFDPSLDQLEAAELGLCRQVIKDDVYCASHRSRGWIRCYVAIDDDGSSFRMYLEKSKRFLVSAKLDTSSSCIRISLYEDYPVHELGLMRSSGRGHVAVLALKQSHGSNVCTLTTSYCAHCDASLGRYSCGRGRDEREVLALISSSTRVFRTGEGSVDVSTMAVSVPPVDSSSGKRLAWCPRQLALHPTEDVCDAIGTRNGLTLQCCNKLPEWSPLESSLVLKFQGNRILSPSHRNFILFEKKQLAIVSNRGIRTSTDGSDVASADAAGSVTTCGKKIMTRKKDSPEKIEAAAAPNPDPTHADNALMQFGRVTADRFILDFRHPLAPVQAFGIALSTYLRRRGSQSDAAPGSPWKAGLSGSAASSAATTPKMLRSTLPSTLVL